MALLVPIAVTLATPPGLLKLAATSLRLSAVLTVAANCLTQIFLGPVDTLLAVIARPRTRRAASQQQYSQYGNQLKVLPTTYLVRHDFLLNNDVFGACSTFVGISIQGS